MVSTKQIAGIGTLVGDPARAAIQSELMLELLKRVVGVKVRDVGIEWEDTAHPVDPRFEPLLKFEPDPIGITGLDSDNSDSRAENK